MAVLMAANLAVLWVDSWAEKKTADWVLPMAAMKAGSWGRLLVVNLVLTLTENSVVQKVELWEVLKVVQLVEYLVQKTVDNSGAWRVG